MSKRKVSLDNDKDKLAIKGHKVTALIIKEEVYGYIVAGYSDSKYVSLVCEKYGISRSTVKNYTADIRKEIRREYEAKLENLRETLMLDLFAMKNNTNVFWEKMKAIEMIMKLTGLSSETLNINQKSEIVQNVFKIESIESDADIETIDPEPTE